jgi:integrase
MVTGSASVPGPEPAGPAPGGAGYPGLLEKLLAAVRPEFRVAVFTVDPRDPVFGGPPCRVRGCGRAARVRGICLGHYHRWKNQGQPDIGEFAATTQAQLGGHRPVRPCLVPGCRYGQHGAGLCSRHHASWLREGKPARGGWLAAQPQVTRVGLPPCRVPYCSLWAEGATSLCVSHGARWRTAGRPPIEQFARACDDPVPGHERFTFGQLAPHLRLEVQYAVQQRHDDGRIRTPPYHVQRFIRAAAASGVGSLLDWPEEQWLGHGLLRSPGASQARSLAVQARRQIEDLHYGRGWDVEYPRDLWRLRNLGITAPQAHIRFGAIPQPWLKDLAKRWARWQLSRGISAGQVARGAAAVARLGRFLTDPQQGASGSGQISREVLERYLAELRASIGHLPAHSEVISVTSTFFRAVRLHRWADLPADAVFYPEDYPKRPQRLPRALAEQVMAQIEDPANLDRWDDPAARLITIILIRCGLRIGDALALPRDCIARDADGAPYLRYFNHKMKREALVPLDEEAEAWIAAQQQHVAAAWPGGSCPHLFPRQRANPDGQLAYPPATYRARLRRWLADCDIRDEHGQPIHLQPHQWRHTLGTRLINRDVPQEVVRRILDHDSHAMTAHYARMHDSTIRRHWEAARKVNINGQTITLGPGGQLADAAWARQRAGRATQALPNGFCGLPLVKQCPHANACLTCPMFITTPEFLPQHREHHRQVLQIISAAQARGQDRLAEMNRQIAGNLDKIITALQEGTHEQPPEATDAS